jgi:hypothetical protein
MAKPKTKTIKITSCTGCPHVKKKSTFQGNYDFECWHPTQIKVRTWPGTKYPPENYGRMIAEACERPLEYPTSFPEWCPL